jgi:hypothetical protein
MALFNPESFAQDLRARLVVDQVNLWARQDPREAAELVAEQYPNSPHGERWVSHPMALLMDGPGTEYHVQRGSDPTTSVYNTPSGPHAESMARSLNAMEAERP